MKTKDLIYIGLFSSLFYLAYKNKKKKTYSNQTYSLNEGQSSDENTEQYNSENSTDNQNEPEQVFGMPLPNGIQSLNNQVSTMLNNPHSSLNLLQENINQIPSMIHNVKNQVLTTEVLPTMTKLETSNNISECGNSFSVKSNDKTNTLMKYWYDGTYYYVQTINEMITSIPKRISFSTYNLACKNRLQTIK